MEFSRIKDLIWGRGSWLFIGILLTAVLVAVTRTPIGIQSPSETPASEIKELPLFLFYSWLRMLSAYCCSLIFAIIIGTLAATKELRAKILLPILDVLQSIPVLGFFPTAIFWFVSMGTSIGNPAIGVEGAVVFLIFTSQSWNLVFAVYDGIKGIPVESTEALKSLGLGPLGLFRRLYIPAVFPRLVYNSVLSWANGWYFLMACEIIAMGPMSYRVKGLGSFLSSAIENRNWHSLSFGLLALVFIIAGMSLLLWKPLDALANQFKFESTKQEGAASGSGAAILSVYRHHGLFSPLRKFLVWLWSFWGYVENKAEPPTESGFHPTREWKWASLVLLAVFWFLVGLALSFALFSLLKSVMPPWSVSPLQILLAILASSLRIAVAYLLSVAWIIPLVYFIHQNPRAMRALNSISQIFASIPATALFPLIAVAAQMLFKMTEIAVLLLLVTGMQWYLLFNVISGAKALPNDIREASATMGVKGWLYVKKVFFPCIMPALVTGSITAVGGGWNALIISEYFQLDKTTFQVFGIGSFIARATYVDANTKLLSLCLFCMVSFIVLLNRYFWQPLYQWAENRFRLEG